MCARYTLIVPPSDLADAFGLADLPDLPPRYNVAPAQLVAVVGLKPDGRRGLARLKWGFVPRWAADPAGGPKPLNAKAETVATKPPFRDSFRDRRCLVPADGFYEWATENGKKVPHHFRLAGGGVFAFAGVWDVWHRDGQPPLHTCALITVPANELVRPVHDRMPAIILPDQYARWLDPATPVPDLLGMLSTLPADRMEVVRVNPVVNKATVDGPECVAPAA